MPVISDAAAACVLWLCQDDDFWLTKRVRLCQHDNLPPIHIIEGWYDLFLHSALEDYHQALAVWKAAQPSVPPDAPNVDEDSEEGQTGLPLAIDSALDSGAAPSVRRFKPYLTIGNFIHIDVKYLYKASFEECIRWYDFHLKGRHDRLFDRPDSRSVKLQMINASCGLAKKNKQMRQFHYKLLSQQQPALTAKQIQRKLRLYEEWRYFPEWPPASTATPLYLAQRQMLIYDAEQLMVHADSEDYMSEIAHMYSQHLATNSPLPAAPAPAPTPTPTPPSAPETSAPVSSPSPPALTHAVPPTYANHYATYVYDPRYPTPSIGGSSFDPDNSGALDNRSMESVRYPCTYICTAFLCLAQ